MEHLGRIDPGAEVGEGTRVWAGAHIMSGAKVGKNCNIGENCFIEGGVIVGNHVTVKNNVALYSGAVIEDEVFLGPSCVFTNVINPRAFISRKAEFKRTLVRRGATVGANATLICGHTVGQYAMIGAGAVVSKDIPDYALAYGCPAEVRGWVCRCGEKLAFAGGRAVCETCEKTYQIEEGENEMENSSAPSAKRVQFIQECPPPAAIIPRKLRCQPFLRKEAA